MITKPSNYDSVQIITALPKLPAGGYVGRILNVKIEEFDTYKVLFLLFDISEGEYTGFYRNNYNMQNTEEKKWKGRVRISIPVDGDEDWKIASFKRAMKAVEDSNKGFAWGWDEMALKDKIVGVLCRNKEYELNDGARGMYTEPFMLIAADDVRSGNYNPPKDKMLPVKNGGYGYTETAAATPAVTYGPVQDDDIPF